MPPKPRKVPDRTEDVEDHESVASPGVSEAGSYSSSGSCPSIALSAVQLESILAAASKASMDSSAKLIQETSKASQDSSAKLMETNQQALRDLLASFSPGLSGSRPPKTVQVKPPRWSDDDTPYDYFSKYEKAMTHNGVDKAEWGLLLPVYLAGRAQAALAQVEILDDYETVKSTLLDSLGDTPSSADRKWWSLTRLAGEDPGSFYLRIRAIGLRRLHGLTTVAQMKEKIILSRYLSLLSADCYAVVSQRQPESGLEASKMVQDFEDTRAYTRKKQPWKDNYHQKRENYNSRGSSPPSGGGGTQSGDSNVSKPSGGGANNKSKPDRQGRRPIICHGCGEPGHIKPNCPHRVRSVNSPDPSSLEVVKGRIAGKVVSGLLVDTGATRTLVREDLIPAGAYTGESVTLDSWRGSQLSKHKVAEVDIEVDGVSVLAKVAVVAQLEYPALLGSDLGVSMKVKLLSMLLEQAKGQEIVSVEVPKQNIVNDEVTMQEVSSDIVRITRAQAEKARLEGVADELASASSGSDPLPLDAIVDIDSEFFVDESEDDVDPVPTPLNECEGLFGKDATEIPLPNLGVSDRDSLRSEQELDPTLKAQWLLGSKLEKGYSFVNGILVHTTLDELGDEFRRILVPKSRRLKVLEIAHTHMLSGHFGRKKTFSKLSARFLWPKMWQEVKEYIRSCKGCQLSSRKDKARAPLQPLQVESEPFNKVAFDIVGPLPTSSSGYKYVLTMMDLFSKFPAAVPLKRVDNLTVLDAMFDVFSCYGLPKVLLTDQGSVFTSRLTKAMCTQFGITKIQTTPYHPQSDGALERFHASLKGMLKRSGGEIKEWDKLLKYLLFAYRSTPHCTTGYAPFTLLFGREVRGPVEILQEAWLDGDGEQATVHEWLTSVKAQLRDMTVLVGKKETVAKSKMKAQFDKSVSIKDFVEGDMVLVWKPGIHAKMGASWDGPYVVGKQRSPVTFTVHVPGRGGKGKVLHVNLLKRWTTPASHIHRVAIVVEEDDEDEICPVGLRLGRPVFVPSGQQQAALDEVLCAFPEVLRKEPGRTSLAELVINTGDHTPVSSHPYRIAPRWRDEVKNQIDQLLQLGIIQPSTSPWSSSVVTVKKKDGGIRICIDFRAVNAITEPDPYQMPLIEELLDLLASAKFISKIDLNKGFHQIPVSASDRCKTAFCTPWGKFEFLVMPFGLRNGPSVFQRLMDQVLLKDGDKSVVYIDDIGIFSSSWEEHCKDICTVLSRLKGAGLTANTSKCCWAQTHCEFLGHLVGEGMVSPADLKVQAVQQFAQPRTKKNVRQFLGLAGYYRRFIPEYASHSFYLTEATKKSAPELVAWSSDMNVEFNYLKRCVCCSPCLTLPVVGDVFILQTDASGVGVGAVLAVIRDGLEYPVAYYSRKLKPRERNYSASEVECLAVISGVRHFDAYLMTHPFTLQTDHRALMFLNSSKQNNGRLARWALLLQQFTFTIKYKKGSLHTNADALSRLPGTDPDGISLPVSSTEKGGDVMGSPTLTPNMGCLQTDSPDSAN